MSYFSIVEKCFFIKYQWFCNSINDFATWLKNDHQLRFFNKILKLLFKYRELTWKKHESRQISVSTKIQYLNNEAQTFNQKQMTVVFVLSINWDLYEIIYEQRWLDLKMKLNFTIWDWNKSTKINTKNWYVKFRHFNIVDYCMLNWEITNMRVWRVNVLSITKFSN